MRATRRKVWLVALCLVGATALVLHYFIPADEVQTMWGRQAKL